MRYKIRIDALTTESKPESIYVAATDDKAAHNRRQMVEHERSETILEQILDEDAFDLHEVIRAINRLGS